MSSLKKGKNTLRKDYLAKRKALKSSDKIDIDRKLCKRLIEFIIWKELHVMHLFLPIPNKNEVDTYCILDHIRANHKQVLAAVPKVAPDGECLDHFFLTETTQLEANKWGIPEPVEAMPVPVGQIDLVLVPMLAFDKAGNRIGYGKGHYDRFLGDCRPDVQKIGLCYFDPVDKIEVESTDVAMNAVVTPNGVWEF